MKIRSKNDQISENILGMVDDIVMENTDSYIFPIGLENSNIILSTIISIEQQVSGNLFIEKGCINDD